MKNQKSILLTYLIILFIVFYILYFNNNFAIFLSFNLLCVFLSVKFVRSKIFSDFKFDKNTAIKFESYMKRYPQFYQHLVDIIKKNISYNKKNPVILDLGIGPGLLSKEINNLLPEANVWLTFKIA